MSAASSKRDVAAGSLLIAFGAGVLAESSRYTIGTVSRMCPGYYPALLGVVMAVVGALIILNRNAGADPHDPAVEGAVDWRGAAAIVGGILSFAVLAAYAGFAPATFALVFIAAMGDRTATVRGAAILALLTTVFGMLLFSYALQLQLPLWRWGPG